MARARRGVRQGGESGVELPSGGGWGGGDDSGKARARAIRGLRAPAGPAEARAAALLLGKILSDSYHSESYPAEGCSAGAEGSTRRPRRCLSESRVSESGGAQCLETALVRTAGKTLAPARKPSENPSHRQSGSSSIAVRIKFRSRLGLRVGPR